jgi:hypothetical protein
LNKIGAKDANADSDFYLHYFHHPAGPFGLAAYSAA